jgi:ribokinase
MSPASHIVVVGSLNMDLTARVSRLPAPGETVLGGELRTAPGGKGGNQAVAAARLGAATRMIACVGDDAYGRELVAGLKREGVDVTGVRAAEGPTGVALICVDDRGQNQIVVAPAANTRLTADMIDGSRWTAGTWVVAQLEVSTDAVAGAFRQANARGARTILNAAPAMQFSVDLWKLTDVLVVNETEAAALAGRSLSDVPSAVAVARALSERGPDTVAVTLGAEGAVIVSFGEAWYIPALPVVAVDATAAGDAWVGALAASLARGADFLTAARTASVAGALTATRHGAQPALPTLDEVTRGLPQLPVAKRLN